MIKRVIKSPIQRVIKSLIRDAGSDVITIQPVAFRSSDGLLIKTSDNKILAVR